jgi:ferritin-like protein
MSDYHEPSKELSQRARSLTRALNSLKEEIEAVDWYNQRVELEQNKELKLILHHNMVEEIEHACMTLEWLRRNMDGWDGHLKEFLFKDGEISH